MEIDNRLNSVYYNNTNINVNISEIENILIKKAEIAWFDFFYFNTLTIDMLKNWLVSITLKVGGEFNNGKSCAFNILYQNDFDIWNDINNIIINNIKNFNMNV